MQHVPSQALTDLLFSGKIKLRPETKPLLVFRTKLTASKFGSVFIIKKSM
jgi:hypothetical protein